VDWKDRCHKKECKRLVKANAAAAPKGRAPRDEAPTPPPSSKPKAAPPVVDGPARGRADVARARAAAAAVTATTAPAPEPEHWRGSPRCPVCLEDWDVNAVSICMLCCCKYVCKSCNNKLVSASCPLCRTRIPYTEEEQLAMLRRNVENGIPAAMRQLGLKYASGSPGLVPSHKKAARLWHRAADLGDVMAMCFLGSAYYYGRGVKLDKKKAVKFYRMPADQGMADAQFNLGRAFFKGHGVALDYVEAARLYKLAADQGHTEAETQLGVMYQCKGLPGVAQDFTEGNRLLKRAAAKGDEGAITVLKLQASPPLKSTPRTRSDSFHRPEPPHVPRMSRGRV